MIEKEQRIRDFTTLDAYLAGFLSLQGHAPRLLKQGQKVAFSFNSNQQLHDSITAYNSGATVEAMRLALAIKTLKSQIFSLRTDKGNVSKKEIQIK